MFLRCSVALCAVYVPGTHAGSLCPKHVRGMVVHAPGPAQVGPTGGEWTNPALHHRPGDIMPLDPGHVSTSRPRIAWLAVNDMIAMSILSCSPRCSSRMYTCMCMIDSHHPQPHGSDNGARLQGAPAAAGEVPDRARGHGPDIWGRGAARVWPPHAATRE